MTLTEFLLARIADDEATARAASPGGWQYGDVESVAGGVLYDETREIANLTYEQPGDHDGSIVRHLLVPEANANGAHIARHDPARVLAECEAKRRIVHMLLARDEDDHPAITAHATGLRLAVKAMASVYADHPDFDPAWRR